jgi:hypothetical protein
MNFSSNLSGAVDTFAERPWIFARKTKASSSTEPQYLAISQIEDENPVQNLSLWPQIENSSDTEAEMDSKEAFEEYINQFLK